MTGRQQARDAVYGAIKRRIVLNELKPGVTLTELGLARALECSQGTVRESLLRLEADGLVMRGGHQGTTVTELDPEAAAELLALRRRIETGAAARIARRTEPADLDGLGRLMDAMVAAAVSGDEYRLLLLDIEFHLAIFRIAGLPALEQILIRCMLHTHRSKLWAPGHRRPLAATAARHRPILAAVEARDARALARSLDHHLDTIVDVAPAEPRAMSRRDTVFRKNA
ncbi:MAG: GntR family transcriptional regulator [Proteobacteria bacterium]|nr:GntR family transcriptional regulator [Pseudomonadota bacterium]